MQIPTAARAKPGESQEPGTQPGLPGGWQKLKFLSHHLLPVRVWPWPRLAWKYSKDWVLNTVTTCPSYSYSNLYGSKMFWLALCDEVLMSRKETDFENWIRLYLRTVKTLCSECWIHLRFRMMAYLLPVAKVSLVVCPVGVTVDSVKIREQTLTSLLVFMQCSVHHSRCCLCLHCSLLPVPSAVTSGSMKDQYRNIPP